MQSQTTGPGGTFEQTIIDLAKSENTNTLAEVRISPETQRRLKRELGLQDQLAAPKQVVVLMLIIILELISHFVAYKIICKKQSLDVTIILSMMSQFYSTRWEESLWL